MNPKVPSGLFAADTISPCREAIEELYPQTPFVVPSNLLAFYVIFGFVRRFPDRGEIKMSLPFDGRTNTESTAQSSVFHL